MQFWEISQRVFVYLAALVGDFSPLSTYFIVSADPVGGGGTHKKARAKNTGEKQNNETLTSPSSLWFCHLEVDVTSEGCDLVSPV